MFVLTHLPLQSVIPPMQLHVPAWQANPLAVSQTLPQEPQLSLSELVSTTAHPH